MPLTTPTRFPDPDSGSSHGNGILRASSYATSSGTRPCTSTPRPPAATTRQPSYGWHHQHFRHEHQPHEGSIDQGIVTQTTQTSPEEAPLLPYPGQEAGMTRDDGVGEEGDVTLMSQQQSSFAESSPLADGNDMVVTSEKLLHPPEEAQEQVYDDEQTEEPPATGTRISHDLQQLEEEQEEEAVSYFQQQQEQELVQEEEQLEEESVRMRNDEDATLAPPLGDRKRPRDENGNDSNSDNIRSLSASLEGGGGSPSDVVAAAAAASSAEDAASVVATTTSTLPVTFEQTRLKDIVGHGAAKLRIDELLLPLALPRSITKTIFTGIRAQPASILLFGPPGCGKTLLARALAGEAQAVFLNISPGDILNKFVGESEAAIRSVFQRAEHVASQVKSNCAVLFFDEIDALGHTRESCGSNNGISFGSGIDGGGGGGGGESDGRSRALLAELLVQLSNHAQRNKEQERSQREKRCSSTEVGDDRSVDSRTTIASNATTGTTDATAGADHQNPPQVLIVGATNRPDSCDPALLRRFGVRIHVGLPSKRDRVKLLRRHLKDFQHVITADDLVGIAEATEGWSPCDLESLAREAAMAPVRACLRAAAMQKKRQRRTQQRRLRQTQGEESGPEEDQATGDQEVRNSLLSGFQSLRPVTLSDFEDAASFYLGQQDQPPLPMQASRGSGVKRNSGMSYGHAVGNKPRQAHYDSSSDEDDM